MKISNSLMLKLFIFLPVITIFYCNTVFAYAIGEILKDDSVSLDVTKDTQLEDTLMNLSLPAATFMSTPVTVSGASVIPLHQENTRKDTGKNRRIKNIITPSTEYNYKKGIDASKQLLSGDFWAQAYRDNKLVTEKNDTAKNAISGKIYGVWTGEGFYLIYYLNGALTLAGHLYGKQMIPIVYYQRHLFPETL